MKLTMRDASCEVKATASQLFVHRNTIQYRLAKIHAITNFKTDDFLSNNLMYQAIACYRLHPELSVCPQSAKYFTDGAFLSHKAMLERDFADNRVESQIWI